MTLTCFYTCLGYIDLSKRRVNPEDMKACEDKFQKAKQACTHVIGAVADRVT